MCGVVVAAGAGAGGCEIAEGLRVGGGREWCHGCFFGRGLTRINTDETQWGEGVNGCFGSREAAKPRREGSRGDR